MVGRIEEPSLTLLARRKSLTRGYDKLATAAFSGTPHWRYFLVSEQLHSGLVVFATGWGPNFGGINSFNYDFCTALAGILRQEQYLLVCVVPVGSIPEGITQKGLVRLLAVETGDPSKLAPYHSQQVLKLLRDIGVDRVGWWFGHDLHTGPLAERCCSESGQGRFAIFHHVNYLITSSLKQRGGDLAVDRRNRQAQLFQAADTVFGVGPKLTSNARSLAGVAADDSKVVEIIPGLPEFQKTMPSATFKACSLGRMTPSDDLIKQGRLAVAALASAVKSNRSAFGDDPAFALIGAEPKEVHQQQKELTELAYKHAGRMLPVLAVPYLQERDQLLGQIADAHTCLMLSLHEGFGLAGWEAIGLEVPLILGQNSGLYRLISERLKGEGTGCVKPIDVKGGPGEENFTLEDLEAVAAAITDIAMNAEEARENARRLRKNLSIYTWKACAIEVAQGCALRSVYLPGEETAGEYVREILDHNIDEIQGSRLVHIKYINDQLDERKSSISHLVLFGGIATPFRDQNAVIRYATWLIRNEGAELFICFESGPSAEARAATLDPTALLGLDDLPRDPLARMKKKEEEVRSLERRMGELIAPALLKRVHIVPLRLTLTTYLILTDDALFISPVLQTRSSLAPSFKISNPKSLYRMQFLEFMLHHLNASGENDHSLARILQDQLTESQLELNEEGVAR